MRHGDTVKLLTIIYDSAIDETMMALLEELGVEGYTKSFDSHGHGGRGRKENTPVHPGTNHQLLIAAPEAEVDRIARTIRRLQESFRLRPGVTMLIQEVELVP
jgi:hypothetical protein